MLWLTAAVGVFVTLRLLIVAMSYEALQASGLVLSVLQLAIALLVLAPLLILAAWFGKIRAARTHEQFLVARLLRRLNEDDRVATLELLGDAVTSANPADRVR